MDNATVLNLQGDETQLISLPVQKEVIEGLLRCIFICSNIEEVATLGSHVERRELSASELVRRANVAGDVWDSWQWLFAQMKGNAANQNRTLYLVVQTPDAGRFFASALQAMMAWCLKDDRRDLCGAVCVFLVDPPAGRRAAPRHAGPLFRTTSDCRIGHTAASGGKWCVTAPAKR